MRPGKACQHKVASGCAIYPNRPENPCKIFQCGWLRDSEALDEELRPDKCGAILLSDRGAAGYDVWRLVPVGRTIPELTMDRFMELPKSLQMAIIGTERSAKFAEGDVSHSTLSSGSEEFISALKWDFSDYHVWDLSPPPSSAD
jgi:hypothetical protein